MTHALLCIIAYSYARYSTREQGKGGSLRRQVEAAKKYCQERGWVLDESLKADKGAWLAAGKGTVPRTSRDEMASERIGWYAGEQKP